MNFPSVQKAIELKEPIDNAYLHLDPIGRCFTLEEEFRMNHINEGETQYKSILAIQDQLFRLYRMQGYMTNPWEFYAGGITVLDATFDELSGIKREDVEAWYSVASPSAYGNVASQQTQYDGLVRSSRELDATKFDVPEELLEAVAETWEESKFVTSRVNVVPHKIVIYGPGDQFVWHKDTPEEKLCGTFLVLLYSDCEPSGVFEINQDGKSQIWEKMEPDGGPSCCAFSTSGESCGIRLSRDSEFQTFCEGYR